jgi:hypothetical protein
MSLYKNLTHLNGTVLAKKDEEKTYKNKKGKVKKIKQKPQRKKKYKISRSSVCIPCNSSDFLQDCAFLNECHWPFSLEEKGNMS